MPFINPEKQQHILNRLTELENEKDIKILYAVESGSRAWGFPSPDSDYDVRFIYIHPLRWYLSLGKSKDHIDLPLNDELDLSGWDITKSLLLFKKLNPSLMEWLESPMIYIEQGTLVNELREIGKQYFSPLNATYYYLHMAKNNYRDYIEKDMVKLKKYFYVLRPLLAVKWIASRKTQPPVIFQDLVDEILIDYPEMISIVKEMLKRKRSINEIGEEPAIPELNVFLREQIEYFENSIESIPKTVSPPQELLNDLFIRILEESWKINIP